MKELTHLSVSFTRGNVTDKSVSQIAKTPLSRLRVLDVACMEGGVSDAVLTLVSEKCPELMFLDVSGDSKGKITEKALEGFRVSHPKMKIKNVSMKKMELFAQMNNNTKQNNTNHHHQRRRSSTVGSGTSSTKNSVDDVDELQ